MLGGDFYGVQLSDLGLEGEKGSVRIILVLTIHVGRSHGLGVRVRG